MLFVLQFIQPGLAEGPVFHRDPGREVDAIWRCIIHGGPEGKEAQLPNKKYPSLVTAQGELQGSVQSQGGQETCFYHVPRKEGQLGIAE